MREDTMIRVTWHPAGEPNNVLSCRSPLCDVVLTMIGMTMAGAVITKVEEIKE